MDYVIVVVNAIFQFLSESYSKYFMIQIRFLIFYGGSFTIKVSIEDAGQKRSILTIKKIRENKQRKTEEIMIALISI